MNGPAGLGGGAHSGLPTARGSALDAAIAALTAEQRTVDASMVRSQTYWLGRQSAEETSLRGVLVDLAEGGSSAVIVVRGSGPCPGTVRLVGDDFAVVESVPGQLLVPLAAVEAIRSAPGRSLPRGRLVALSGVTLRCLLTELSADRPRMVATSTSGERSAGELRSVGADVIRMVDPTTRSDVLVPLESVCEVLLPTQ